MLASVVLVAVKGKKQPIPSTFAKSSTTNKVVITLDHVRNKQIGQKVEVEKETYLMKTDKLEDDTKTKEQNRKLEQERRERENTEKEAQDKLVKELEKKTKNEQEEKSGKASKGNRQTSYRREKSNKTSNIQSAANEHGNHYKTIGYILF